MEREVESIDAACRVRRLRTWWLFSALFVVAVGTFWLWPSSPSPAELIRRARAEFEQGHYKQAERLAARALLLEGTPADAALLAGRAAAKQRRFEKAVEYYNHPPDNGSPAAVTARCEAGDLLLLELKRPLAAESQFRRAIAQDKLDVRANNRLSQILGVTARSRDAIPFRLRLIKLDAFEPLHLYLLCMGDSVLENLDLLHEWHRAAPDDPLLLLGLAREALDKQDHARTEALLRQVIAARPDLVEARVKLGQFLFDHGDEKEFLAWHSSLPNDVESHPNLWLIRGKWAIRNSQSRAAARCFWEAVRIDPNHESANYQLSQTLAALGETKRAEPFFERSRKLTEYFDTVKVAWTGKDLDAIRRATETAESLGLIWEAYGWSRLMVKHFPQTVWAARASARLSRQFPQLKYERSPPAANLTTLIDLAGLPLPQMPDGVSTSSADPTVTDFDGRLQVTFADRAAVTGMVFRYHNRAEGKPATRRMYEFNGGGVAILDYDADGLPDIYFTEGATWPLDLRQTTYLDKLFHNLGDGRFEEVSALAGIVENGFSGGVTVGDYNGDGFADLYVANIGGNRFFENNGDGTFSEITETTQTASDSWSTSCVLADLNGDGLPDLYVVNYLEGEGIYSRVCPDSAGVTRSCSPRHFPAAADRLYLNRGDGGFDDVTNRSGIRVPDGKGLGIVAADFSGNGRLDLFVANDAVPNFLFANQTKVAGDALQFVERALLLGLAVNEEGRPEACMGVAAGDADGDGRLDLIVTNFFNESNTFFQQHAQGQFVDTTRRFGLHDLSLKRLGFGAQFLDADLDGRLDLMVTNGHVDDLSDIGRQYEMPCEYFSNVGNRRFKRVAPKALGPFFEKKHLGRALARIDWNRDGLDDAVISHLNSPAALLTNTTASAGNFVAIRLVGVKSSRDAIGTTLTAEIGKRKLMRQLTAGDGYQVSNERRVVFGLDAQKQIDVLHVRWPSGTVQQFKDVPANSELLLIEGRALFSLPESN